MAKRGLFRTQEQRAELIQRVTKILHCHDENELEIDKDLLDNLTEDSEDPMFIVSEIFRDSLYEMGLAAESAETARKTFLTLKFSQMEQTQNKIKRIASQMNSKEQVKAADHAKFSSSEESKKDSKFGKS